MADNVIQFRKLDKKPGNDQKKPPGGPPKWPAWLPFAVLVGVAVLIVLAQHSGAFAG